MEKKSPSVIEYAVRTCLEKCAQTDMPMTCLTDYMAQLQDSGWDGPSIADFQIAVLRSLAKPKGQPDIELGPAMPG